MTWMKIPKIISNATKYAAGIGIPYIMMSKHSILLKIKMETQSKNILKNISMN